MADRDASELGRCPECLVLEGRHAHDCVTGDKAFEAHEAARQHPTTPTPEPAAPTFTATDWSAFCKVRGCSIPFEHEHHGEGQAAEPQLETGLRSEIADLRGKLERAERERGNALDSCTKLMQDRGRVAGERDAATSRATEAERLLREVCEADESCVHATNQADALDSDRYDFAMLSRAVARRRSAITTARKHLSTLPGSKEGE